MSLDNPYQLVKALVDTDTNIYAMVWTINPEAYQFLTMDTFITPHRPYALYINPAMSGQMSRLPVPTKDQGTEEWRRILTGPEELVNRVSWEFIDKLLRGLIVNHGNKESWLLPIKVNLETYNPPKM